MPRICAGELRDLVERARELDAAALAAAAGVDLRLDDPDRAAELLRRLGRLAHAERRDSRAAPGRRTGAGFPCPGTRGSSSRVGAAVAEGRGSACGRTPGKSAGKCSTRPRAGRRAGAARRARQRPQQRDGVGASQARFAVAAATSAASRRPSHQSAARPRARSRGRQKARLRARAPRHRPGPRAKRRARTARGALQLGRGERLRRSARQRDARAGASSLPDAQVAEARPARAWTRDSAKRSSERKRFASSQSSSASTSARRRLVAGVAAVSRSAAASTIGALGGAAPRPRAWRSSLRRSSSRLWSRCASSCSARALSDSGALQRQQPSPAAQSLTTFSLAGAASSSAAGQQRDADRLAHLVLDLDREVGVLAQELARVVLALADLLAVVGVPGAALLEHLGLDAHVDDLALAADALAVEDVELGGLERRRDLVLDDLDLGLVADDLFALLDRADAADVEPHRGVELERVAAGGGLGRAEHHADLHADLVDEDDHRVGLLDRRR